MTDLEKLIRNALDAGSTSDAIAKQLTDTLNKIKAEEKVEAEKREAQRNAAVVNRYEKLINEFRKWHADHQGHDIGTAARMGAIVALSGVIYGPDNKDWTVEDVDELVEAMTRNIKALLEAYKGHANDEERAKRLIKGAMNEFEKSFKSRFLDDSDSAYAFNNLSGDVGDSVRSWIRRHGL